MAIPINQDEVLALDNFRSMVDDLPFGDGVLMRFLRARELDTVQAEDMLRKFVEWRVTATCNQYLGWTTPLELFKLEMYITGFDDEDRPVLYTPYGIWPSLRDMIESGLEVDLLKLVGKMMDKLHKLCLLTKHQQFVSLVDFDGVTFSKMFHEARSLKGLSVIMRMAQDYEKNYPELLSHAIHFNAPTAFMWAWKILSPCFAPYTLSKIKFYGTGSGNQKEWEAAIFDSLPDRCIPPQYGGTATLRNVYQDISQAWEDHCLIKKKGLGNLNHNYIENIM